SKSLVKFFRGGFHAHFGLWLDAQLPVAPDHGRKRVCQVERQRRPAKKLMNAFKKGIRRVIRQAPFQKSEDRLRVRPSGHRGGLQNLFNLGPKEEIAVVKGVVERLHAKTVSRAEDPLFDVVPQGK